MTPYGAWYGMNGEPWCAMFVSWCANQAGILGNVVPMYAYCPCGKNWYADKGRYRFPIMCYTPKEGDVVFYRSNGVSCHTGIVIGCNASTHMITTIEGNEGQAVRKVERSYLNNSYVDGFGDNGGPTATIKLTPMPDITSNAEYDKAKVKLCDVVYQQYPAARIKFNQKNKIEDVLKDYKDEINKAAKKYGVPPALIAGSFVKEQITQSILDEVALIDFVIRENLHSTGLGAIFASTAQKDWYTVGPRVAYINSINTIAVVLTYYAREKYITKDTSSLTMEQWKVVVGRYNANYDNPNAQKKYSNNVYGYLDSLNTMLK